MTAESDGKSTRTGQPDLLASLPAEGSPASQPASGIDPAVIEELLTGVRDLREQVAGLKEAAAAVQPAPVRRETLEAWGENLVTRVAEAARPADAPKDDAAAKTAAAAERNGGELDSTADQVAAEVKETVTRIEKGLAATRDHVTRQAGSVIATLDVIRTQTAGPKFGWRTVLVGLVVFVLGMLLESHIHLLYRWQ